MIGFSVVSNLNALRRTARTTSGNGVDQYTVGEQKTGLHTHLELRELESSKKWNIGIRTCATSCPGCEQYTHMQALPPPEKVILNNVPINVSTRLMHGYVEEAGNAQVGVDAWNTGVINRWWHLSQPPLRFPFFRIVTPQVLVRVASRQV